MSYPKVTAQNYNNLGGINEKASEYSTDRTQFLRLSNFDFSIPNALTQRAGTTQIVGLSAGHSAPITSLYEYTKFEGYSEVVFGSQFGLHKVAGSGFTSIISNSNVAEFDYQTFNNQLWAFNGQTSIDYFGPSTYAFGVPRSVRFAGGFSTSAGVGFSFGASTFGVAYLFSYIKFGGQELPNLYLNSFVNTTTTINSLAQNEISAVGLPSGTIASIFLNVSLIGVPAVSLTAFGVEKLGVYRAVISDATALSTFGPNLFTKLTEIDVGSTQFIDTFGASTFPQNPGYPNYEQPFWSTTRFSSGSGSASLVYVPSFVEVYNNAFFLAGFSSKPSRVYFSEIGQPENIKPENFFDVRTNDGDTIRGIKTFLDQHLIFKEESFHRVTGDDVTNYTLVQVTDEYGALNNKVIVEAENKLYIRS